MKSARVLVLILASAISSTVYANDLFFRLLDD